MRIAASAPIIFAVFFTGSALAVPLEINAVSAGEVIGSSPGTSRGISFGVNSAFSISSVGLYSNIGSTSYNVNIFSSTDGNQLTSLLDSATATVGGLGLQWYDIAIDFDFSAGAFYAIEWETTSGDPIPGGTDFFHYGRDENLPLDTGPVTLINGFDALGFENILHPRLRVDVVESVPSPGVLSLLGLGIAAIGYQRRKHKACS